ncbi:MAG: hypothetical protein ACRET5_12925 [Steroidobacteraceae bacterium]
MIILCIVLMAAVTAAIVGLLGSAIIGSDDALHPQQAQSAEIAGLPTAVSDPSLRKAA